jgi:spore germination protein YaaH
MKQTLLQLLRRLVHYQHADQAAYAISVVLLVLSVWLPPFSAGTRLLHADYPAISTAGGAVSTADGAQLLVPAGALSQQLRLKMMSLTGLDFLGGVGDKAEDVAAEALTAEPVTLQGDLYRFRAYGPAPKQALLTVPLPESVPAAVADVYAWDGKQWSWVPAEAIAEDQVVEAHLSALPQMAAVVQMKQASPSIGTVLTAGTSVPENAAGLLTEINPDSFYVNADGTVSEAGAGSINVPQGYLVVPVVSNRKDGQVQPDLLNTILLNAEARSQNIAALTALAVEKMYTGVQLDYRGLNPSLREEYTSFVAELAGSLHKQGKILAVRVEAPQQVAEDRWETGAYDWQALGESADAVVIPAIESPSAYAPGGQMEALLRWAVSQVQRSKLQVAVSVYGYDMVGETITRIPYMQGLAEVAQLAVAVAVASSSGGEAGTQLVCPGDDVTLSLSRLCDSGGLQCDLATGTYWFSYRDEVGTEHKVWLENVTSLARKLQMVVDYNIHGVMLEDLLDPQNDEHIWDLLQHFKELMIPAMESDFTVVWTVTDPTGQEASVAGSLLEGEVAAASQASVGSSYVWTVPNNPGDYVISAAISDDGGQTADVRSDSVSLQVPSPTPTPTPTATPTATPTPLPTATPKPTAKPVAAAPKGPGFGYGVQGDAITDSDHGRLFGLIQQLGFGWFKQQVEWFRYNPAPGQYDWGSLDRIVDSANAAGIKLLFSVVKAPQWARPSGDTDQGPPSDPNVYGEFLKAMATHYKGRVAAYEIWNEQNLYYEWGGLGGKLNAGKYVQLLKVAYQAIKSADSGATVISGALTPTGYNDGNIAIDDRVYLEQMYQAGMKNYCDAVGAHPSGYNNPPDAKWETYSDATASFNAKGHPSWFFRGTLESYRNIMIKYGDSAKRIWVTEFGWASVESLGVAPARGYEYAADTTEAEQAQYITNAYRLAKSWGWVGPMFLWNLNFGPICGAGDEKSAFSIIRPDWSMRPAFAGLVNMPK